MSMNENEDVILRFPDGRVVVTTSPVGAVSPIVDPAIILREGFVVEEVDIQRFAEVDDPDILVTLAIATLEEKTPELVGLADDVFEVLTELLPEECRLNVVRQVAYKFLEDRC